MRALSAARHRLAGHRPVRWPRRRRLVPLLAVLGALGMVAGFLGYAGSASAADLTARFDWSMPDRLNNRINGAPDTNTPTAQYISPGTWHVDLDGCASRPPDRPIIRYEWGITIDGRVKTNYDSEVLGDINLENALGYSVGQLSE